MIAEDIECMSLITANSRLASTYQEESVDHYLDELSIQSCGKWLIFSASCEMPPTAFISVTQPRQF